MLVHGLGGNSLNWVDLTEGLADRLECVSLDLPGFGATEPLASADYSIPAHAGAVAATIEALFPGSAGAPVRQLDGRGGRAAGGRAAGGPGAHAVPDLPGAAPTCART